MTDPNGDDAVPPPALPDPNQQDYRDYEFTSTDWDLPPVPADADCFGKEESTIRDAHAYSYQQYGTTYNWSRYVNLGYFAYTHCGEFDKNWTKVQDDPLTVHRAIWYNFTYHVARDIPMSEPLTNWALNFSQPFLEYHDIKYLDVDTMKNSTGVASTVQSDQTNNPNPKEWIEVTNKKRTNKKQEPAPDQPTKTGGILRATQQNNNGKSKSKKKGSNTSDNTVQPNAINETAAGSVDNTTIRETESESEVEMEIDDTSTDSTNLNNSVTGPPPAITEAIPPHPKIPTNDGTHRITVRWTAPSDVTEFDTEPNRLNEALHTLMTTLFQDGDGVFYKWDSDDETMETRAASSLTQDTAREFVSPKVTIIGSRSMMVFGLRFGFLSSPGKWQYSDRTKAILKEQHLSVLLSNSKSTSGDLVTAGYILLKAPNTTHRNYYTQYLRSKLPEATPYFDILRYTKTPMDQSIPHLVVQCGANHVTPVCQGLLTILTGAESALFLPRYAINTMPPEQVKRHFEVHSNWSRSLTPISLVPKIYHLDQQRVEYFDNGTILKRSTRDWALSLTLENGKSAHCDVVNGGSDRKATLACPHSFLAQAHIQWKAYKSRLNPPSHREARYVNSIAGLPDLQNISIEITPNVSVLDQLSAANVWQQAPPSVRAPKSHSKRKKSKNTNPPSQSITALSTPQNATTTVEPSIDSDAASDTTSGDITNDESETHSTASTAASSTAPPPSDNHSRFKDLERMIKAAQKRSDVEGKASAAQLSGLQSQFSDLNCKMSALHTTQQQLATDITGLQDNSAKQFASIHDNMLTSMEATNNLSQSMVDIRSQITTMSTFMLDLAKKMEAVMNRREGVPPEVNIDSATDHNQTGSEVSSCPGNPSQSTNSELSRAVSLLSSAGKRSLAASHIPAPHHEETKTTPRPSPIKKKQRARGIPAMQNDDSTDYSDDDETADNPLLAADLEERFREAEEQDDMECDDLPDDVTTQEPGAPPPNLVSTDAPPEPPSSRQLSQSTASPNHQYNNANGSAEARPP
jgi:hypothetical protein